MKNVLRLSSNRLSRKTVTCKSGGNKQWSYAILDLGKTRVQPGSAPSIRHRQCEYQGPGAGNGAAILLRRIEYARQGPERTKMRLPPASVQIRRRPRPQAGTARQCPALGSCARPDPRARSSRVPGRTVRDGVSREPAPGPFHRIMRVFPPVNLHAAGVPAGFRASPPDTFAGRNSASRGPFPGPGAG